jgi:hypothetical protein
MISVDNPGLEGKLRNDRPFPTSRDGLSSRTGYAIVETQAEA